MFTGIKIANPSVYKLYDRVNCDLFLYNDENEQSTGIYNNNKSHRDAIQYGELENAIILFRKCS